VEYDLEKMMLEIIDKVFYVGYLGAQHFISVLILLCDIKDPSYIKKALVLENTQTAKKLSQNTVWATKQLLVVLELLRIWHTNLSVISRNQW